MSNLRDQMKKNMELRGFSPKTQYAYLNHIRHFQDFFEQPLESMGTNEIRDFLHYCITKKKVSRSYVNTTYSTLRFMYETTLGRHWDIKQIPRVKRDKRLPVALAQDEVQRLFAVTTNLKHKAMLMIAYDAGLRVSEVANLKISDIDSANMQIIIRLAKGRVDRYSLLSQTVLKILREYYLKHQPKLWLFPGAIPDKPIHTRSIQRVFEEARDKAGITKKASVHSLRHSFATHLLEEGINIVYIQKLLGHANITTTLRYLHLVQVKIVKVPSPLELFSKEEKSNDSNDRNPRGI